MSTPPFELPAEPVDRHEVRWFSYVEVSDGVYVHETRAQYFQAAADYTSVVDKDWAGDRGGAPVENEWFIWEDGRPHGRADGWRPRHWFDAMRWDNCFATRDACVIAARTRLVDLMGDLYRRAGAIVDALNNDPKLRPSRTIDEMCDASEMAASSATTGGGARAKPMLIGSGCLGGSRAKPCTQRRQARPTRRSTTSSRPRQPA